MKTRKILVQCFVIIVFCYSVFARQSATVQLTGRILDPTGAVIPGIVVSAFSQTKAKYESYADEEGVYVLTLPKGIYNLEINKQDVKYNGFEFVRFNNYQVIPTQNGKLNFDIALPVAGNGIICELIVSDSSEESKQSKKGVKNNKGKNNKQ